MAKCPPLYTGEENSKRFDFVIDDDDFEEHTCGFVPATTAADTQKCIKFNWFCLLESSVYLLGDLWKVLFAQLIDIAIYGGVRGACHVTCPNHRVGTGFTTRAGGAFDL